MSIHTAQAFRTRQTSICNCRFGVSSSSLISFPQAGANQPELTGYHVKRDEFEPEYDVEAEHLVAELDFVPGEPQARYPSITLWAISPNRAMRLRR